MRLIPTRPVSRAVLACAALATPWTSLTAQESRERADVLAIEVGTVHPVAGPAIENAVIVIRRGVLVGVGPAGEVRVPPGAQVLKYPEAHAYPGLVDALSTAFASAREVHDASTDAGSDFASALDPTDEDSRALVRNGVTTAYVGNQSTALWRGRGAIVRPQAKGFGMLRDKRHGGLGLRMTSGPSAGHALDRLKAFDQVGAVFDTLEEYEKQQKDYAKAKADYEKAFAKYLEHHRSKAPPKPEPEKPKEGGEEAKPKAGEKAEAPGDKPSTPGPAPEGGESGGRGGRGRGRFRPRSAESRPGAPDGTPPPAAAPGGAKPTSTPAASGEEPKKPAWPKPVKKDDAKEALLAVVQGKLPLRVEAHRKEEIRAALFLAAVKELPGLTLEHASEAAEIAGEVARAGAPVVLTDLLPGTAADYEKTRDGTLAARLDAAGVPVAIASGSAANARNLTLMAAYACGQGLPEDKAVRALTLTPAEILGVADQVGSLERGKVADVVITSGPLLKSSTRVLRVISQGQTQFEAK